MIRATARYFALITALATKSLNSLSWLGDLDTYRTMCLAPEPTIQRLLEDIREIELAV